MEWKNINKSVKARIFSVLMVMTISFGADTMIFL